MQELPSWPSSAPQCLLSCVPGAAGHCKGGMWELGEEGGQISRCSPVKASRASLCGGSADFNLHFNGQDEKAGTELWIKNMVITAIWNGTLRQPLPWQGSEVLTG